MMPLCIDLYCGLGGWTEGFLAEGYDVIGFDIERRPYPGQLVVQDVLTLHGAQFRDAAVIVGSSPCQEFSYRAMPWKRAKALPPPELGIRLFEAQFRIQREACEAAGRYIPLVVENVCGAQRWVGRARAHYGSYYLWGDVESVGGRIIVRHMVRFGAPAVKAYRAQKTEGLPDLNGHDGPKRGRVTTNGSWFAVGSNGKSNLAKENHDSVAFYGGDEQAGSSDCLLGGIHHKEGTRAAGDIFSVLEDGRKEASALIAKIPFDLAQHIARCFKPAAIDVSIGQTAPTSGSTGSRGHDAYE
jgi:hypothetical protein